MSAAANDHPKPKPIDECRDVYDVLEHARLRPAPVVADALHYHYKALRSGSYG